VLESENENLKKLRRDAEDQFKKQTKNKDLDK
jgi:ribosome recycling factor